MCKDNHIVLQKGENPHSKQIGVQQICTELCGKDNWITVSFQTFLPIPTQDHTSLCKTQGRIAWSVNNATIEVVHFVL